MACILGAAICGRETSGDRILTLRQRNRPANTPRPKAPVGRQQGARAARSQVAAPTPLVVTARHGQFFEEADAEAVFKRTGMAPDNTDYVHVAAALDEIAQKFVVGYRLRAVATAGTRAKWQRRIESRARALLADCGIKDPLAPPSYQVIHALLCDGPPGMGQDLNFRRTLAEILKCTEVPGEWDVTRAALHLVQFLQLRARLAATKLEEEKRGSHNTSGRDDPSSRLG